MRETYQHAHDRDQEDDFRQARTYEKHLANHFDVLLLRAVLVLVSCMVVFLEQ